MTNQGETRSFRACTLLVGCSLLVGSVQASPSSDAAENAKLRFSVTDTNGQAMPCRIHLTDSQGKAVRAPGFPFFRTHFSCTGNVELAVPPGEYRYRIERGPEFQREVGTANLVANKPVEISVTLPRIADLAGKGWYSGDLHVHRAPNDMKLLMRSEDLHVAPVITWWNNRNVWADMPIPESTLVEFDGNRCYDLISGEDEREGGALMYFHLGRPLPITGSSREYPSPMKFVLEARKHDGAWIDIEKPFWWDVPVWLASGQMDSIGLANNHMYHDGMLPNEAWGKPRDESRLPPPQGNGWWTQEIYYHILNAGIRIPPSAGSASGVLPNPLGYNRVYTFVGDQFTCDGWWQALKAGRSFVTNGPLLLVEANGELPGHVFEAPATKPVDISIDVSLTSLDVVPAIEVVKNGEVVLSVAPSKDPQTQQLPNLRFEESGWFLVRAVTDLPHTFRFASTAPYYVEIGPEKSRISRRSAQFFLDWVNERIARVKANLSDPTQLAEVLKFHDQAKAFWQNQFARANAD